MEQVGTTKLFFDVFPTLKVENSVRMLFSDVEVKKITTNSARNFLHIYIFSRHLFQKKQIWHMEQKIKEQLFGTSLVNIHIEEEYSLSEQYTPAALMAEYRESISQELRGSSVLAANMFDQAELRFEENQVCCLELADTIVSEGRREQILNLLNEVFNRRCGIPTEFRVTYREKEESKTREFEEQRIQREINAIFRRNKSIHGETDSGGMESGAGSDHAAPWEDPGGPGSASGSAEGPAGIPNAAGEYGVGIQTDWNTAGKNGNTAKAAAGRIGSAANGAVRNGNANGTAAGRNKKANASSGCGGCRKGQCAGQRRLFLRECSTGEKRLSEGFRPGLCAPLEGGRCAGADLRKRL